ncbi:MAG: nucleoside hydrolase [Lachnospiraceae bacterium]|nr:nucleoside hydrolase [Lachnospiraceae bacterium]
MAYPVWIDVDTGVDDAVAIIVAHGLKELDILGISAVCGNTSLENSLRNTMALNVICGSSYPVFKGAERPLFREPVHAEEVHGKNGLGDVGIPVSEEEEIHKEGSGDDPSAQRSQGDLKPPSGEAAWDALYKAACRHPRELRVIATAPLTNLALAFFKYPDLPGLLNMILIMGGSASEGNLTPCAEFNIYADPEAAEAVFRSGVPIVLCPLDVTERVYLTEEDMEEIKGYGSRAGQFVYDILRKPWSFHKTMGNPGVQMHDSCPVLYLYRPELFTAKEAGVYVETKGRVTVGKTVTDLYSDRKFDKRNAVVALDADAGECIRIIKECIKKLP